MSWHCLFCGNPEIWMRGKESKKSKMVEVKIFRELTKTVVYDFVCHSDCLWRVLTRGQTAYLKDGFLDEFVELKNESNR